MRVAILLMMLMLLYGCSTTIPESAGIQVVQEPVQTPQPPKDPGVILPKYEGAPIPPDPQYPQTITLPLFISSTGISPNGYVIYVNDTVKLDIMSFDDAYTFLVEDLSISVLIPALGSAQIQFVPRKSGNFTYKAGSSVGTFYSVVRP